jgi:hypothetical protein
VTRWTGPAARRVEDKRPLTRRALAGLAGGASMTAGPVQIQWTCLPTVVGRQAMAAALRRDTHEEGDLACHCLA